MYLKIKRKLRHWFEFKMKALTSLLILVALITVRTLQHLWTEDDKYKNNYNTDSSLILQYKGRNVAPHCYLGETLPNGAFCLSIDSGLEIGGIFIFDGELCKNIETLIKNSSIVDFGAGLGHYGKCLLREPVQINIKNKPEQRSYAANFEKTLKKFNLSGTPRVIKSYEGYDGSFNIGQITMGFVKPINLDVPFDLGKRFDWVMSLEVGEHIPKDAEDIFLRNLISHSCKGIILSWAIQKQRGLGHINCQSNEYIISKMKQLGFSHDLHSQNQLRTDSLQFDHFKDTLMVFNRLIPMC